MPVIPELGPRWFHRMISTCSASQNEARARLFARMQTFQVDGEHIYCEVQETENLVLGAEDIARYNLEKMLTEAGFSEATIPRGEVDQDFRAKLLRGEPVNELMI